MTSHHRIGFFKSYVNLCFRLSTNKRHRDIDVDDHHVTEDIGIVIGQLLLEMIKDKSISFVMEQCIFQWMKH